MELHFGEQFKYGIEHEEFKVYYQPKVSLHDYRLIGAEALCRWFHNGIIIPPDSFIPYLEQTGDICRLDFYMLEHVCRDLQKWLSEGLRCVKVSVNLSRRHELNDELLNKIIGIIDSHQIPHEYIEIELVETHNDMNFSALKQMVNALKENNISTSVDDFGIGYSSLNLIRDLPWDILKIDKSFLPENNANHRQHIMLKHVIAMAQDLGLDCIVEGVETIEQIKLLKEYNCYMAQGYFFDKPLPEAEFKPKLRK